MRILRYILCLCFLIPIALTAQTSKNLSKIEIGKIHLENDEDELSVRPGEFKVDYYYFRNGKIMYNNPKKYKYVVLARNKNNEVKKFFMKNILRNFNSENSSIEILRAGYTLKDMVYIKENKDSETNSSKYKLYVNGNIMGPYDRIHEILPDGIIYKNRDMYTFIKYDDEVADNRNFCILEKEEYKNDTIKYMLNNNIIAFVPKDNVDYYTNINGNYYLVYNDNRMDNTLLVVNGYGYELDGSISNLLFKFSHDGQHWILSCQNYVMVDGVIVVRISGMIKYVDIKNDGQFAYVIQGNGFNDRLYVNENIIVNGVEVKNLTVDEKQRFNYIVRNKKGYFYGIDNDINSFNDHMRNYYYPKLLDNSQVFTVKSLDGKHSLSYSYDRLYITIDDRRVDCKSIPHYAIWNEDEKCFIWNVVEGSKLMIYKYKMR